MGIYGNFKRLLKIPKKLTLGKTILFFAQLIFLFNLSLLAPLLIRYVFAANFIEIKEPVDFIFHTCMDELSGVCSYPQVDIVLEEKEIEFTPGHCYGFQMELEAFDDEMHKKFGIFMAQLQTRDFSGTAISTFKKPVSFRESKVSMFKKLRNFVFWPLWLIGFFNEPPSTLKNIFFTNQFIESPIKRTSIVSIQLQQRHIQVHSAILVIHDYVGISSYIFTTYPISTYLFLVTIHLTIFLSIFAIYWAFKGINVINLVLHEEEQIAQSQQESKQSFSKPTEPTFEQDFLNRKTPPISKKDIILKRTPSPSPVTRTGELPECPYLENIPGWNVIPKDSYGNNLIRRKNNFNSKFFE